MGILWTLIIGLVVGAIAKLLMPGKDPGGFIVTMLIGVAGALLAGFLGRALGWYANPGEGRGSSPRSSARCCCCCSTGCSWGGGARRFRKQRKAETAHRLSA